MLQKHQTNLRNNAKSRDSYHCHFALKDLLNNLIKINYLGLTHYKYTLSSMAVKIDRAYFLRFPVPVTGRGLKNLSASIHKFTNAKELTLYKVLLENTSLTKLKDDHCTRCPQIDACKAFLMSSAKPN